MVGVPGDREKADFNPWTKETKKKTRDQKSKSKNGIGMIKRRREMS